MVRMRTFLLLIIRTNFAVRFPVILYYNIILLFDVPTVLPFLHSYNLTTLCVLLMQHILLRNGVKLPFYRHGPPRPLDYCDQIADRRQ